MAKEGGKRRAGRVVYLRMEFLIPYEEGRGKMECYLGPI